MERQLQASVLRAGRVVDQRWVARREVLTAGTSAACRCRVGGAGVPREHVLFDFRSRAPLLRLLPGMAGEIALDGRVPRRVAARTPEALPLPPQARGWVALGDSTILFQVGVRPPPPPRRTLPPGARTGLLSALDPRLLAALAIVALAEAVAVGAVMRRADPARPDAVAEYSPVGRIAPLPRRPEPPAPAIRPRPARPREAPRPASPPGPATREEVRRRVAVAGVNGALRRLALAGAMGKVLGERPDRVLAEAFRDLRRMEPLPEGPPPIRDVPRGPGTPFGPLDLPAGDPGPAPREVGRRHVAMQIELDPDEVETPPEIPPDETAAVAGYVRAHLRLVQACYERHLKVHSAAAGRLYLRFVLAPDGRVTRVEVAENTLADARLSECAANVVSAWVLPVRPAAPVAVGFPLLLVPTS